MAWLRDDEWSCDAVVRFLILNKFEFYADNNEVALPFSIFALHFLKR